MNAKELSAIVLDAAFHLHKDLGPGLLESAIAAVIFDMDAALAALEASSNKTHARKQAMMQELLTGTTRLV